MTLKSLCKFPVCKYLLRITSCESHKREYRSLNRGELSTVCTQMSISETQVVLLVNANVVLSYSQMNILQAVENANKKKMAFSDHNYQIF